MEDLGEENVLEFDRLANKDKDFLDHIFFSDMVEYAEKAKLLLFVVLSVSFFAFLYTLGFLSYYTLSENTILVKQCEGKYESEYINQPGGHFINSFCEYTKVNIGEREYSFSSLSDLAYSPITADKVNISVNARLSLFLDYDVVVDLLKKYETVDKIDRVVLSSLSDAVHRSVLKFYWDDSNDLSGSLNLIDSRDGFVTEIKDRFSMLIYNRLILAGISEDIAMSAFKVGDPVISGLTTMSFVKEYDASRESLSLMSSDEDGDFYYIILILLLLSFSLSIGKIKLGGR